MRLPAPPPKVGRVHTIRQDMGGELRNVPPSVAVPVGLITPVYLRRCLPTFDGGDIGFDPAVEEKRDQPVDTASPNLQMLTTTSHLLKSSASQRNLF